MTSSANNGNEISCTATVLERSRKKERKNGNGGNGIETSCSVDDKRQDAIKKLKAPAGHRKIRPEEIVARTIPFNLHSKLWLFLRAAFSSNYYIFPLKRRTDLKLSKRWMDEEMEEYNERIATGSESNIGRENIAGSLRLPL